MDIALKYSDKLYANENIPIEDIEIISAIIEEFVDRFHHGKEEQAYFLASQNKDQLFDLIEGKTYIKQRR